MQLGNYKFVFKGKEEIKPGRSSVVIIVNKALFGEVPIFKNSVV